MKKLKYFFASAIVLVAVAISTIVFAEYKEQKGDLRVGNTISNKNVSVNAGSSNLINDGDVKVVKTVSKTDTEGVYNVKFDISAKEKENEKTTPIYAVVVFDNSGSMICDSKKGSYAYSKDDAEKMTINYNYNHNKRENLDYYFEEYKSALGDNTSVYCTKYTEEPIGWFDTKLVKIEGDVVLNNKWESAVKGTKSFTNEILSIDSSKISYVPFASSAQTASKWYANGDTIPSSVYSHPVGATNLSDAINKAYNKLSERTIPTNAKKIIIVISDGEPTEPGDYPIQSAKDSANEAKKAGIKIYSIGYAVDKDSTAATVLNNISSNSTNDKTNYSFLAGQDNVSDIFKKLATDITTVYAKNATLTDTIGGNFKFTSSNDNVKVNGQNVSFSIDKLTRQTQSFSFNITIDDENITEDGWYPTNDGFNLTYTDVYGNSQKITSPEDPEVYWVAKRYDYKIEYYYDGQIDNALTETDKDVKGTEITVSEESIKNNTKTGYKLKNVDPENKMIYISSNEEENIIRVYYVKDETQTKDLSYTVEYYKNGVKVTEDTQTVKDTVQVLKPDTLTVDKSNINTKDKYVGYKFEKTNPTEIPNTIENGSVIKVYYVKGTYKYTVNYYYDNVLDKDSTDTFEAKYEDVITTYEQKIRTGYVLDKVTGLDLTISADESKNVINVYYKKAKYSYVVEYYYDNVLEGTKTDTFEATYNEVIETYKDKVITGYKLDKIEGTPLTVTEIATNNIIRVYYEKDTFTYEVRYYFNRELDESLTEKGTALFGEKITSYTDKAKEDYTLETVENLPLVISEDESKNIINVYYKIDGQGVIEPIEPPHTSANNSIYALILLVNALGASVLLKKREN